MAAVDGRPEARHRPVHVYLQIASACNLDCYMCSEHNRPEEARHGVGLLSMRREIYDKIARDVFPYSNMLTIGVGGEPTLSPDFAYFVERAFDAGQEIHVITNGTRIYKSEVAAALAHRVSFLQISVDAATKETYERIRRGSRWASICRNLDELAKLRENSKHRRSYLVLAFVLMRSNVHELPAFIQFAKKAGADAVRAQHCIPVTEEGKAESLIHEPELYNNIYGECLRLGKSLQIELLIPLPYPPSATRAAAPPPLPHLQPSRMIADDYYEPPNAQFASLFPSRGEKVDFTNIVPPAPPNIKSLGRAIPCSMPTVDLYVLYDGRVFPCCHPFAHSKMSVGDLRTQEFNEIWNGKLYKNLRAGLRSGDAPLACRTCSLVHDPPPDYEDPERIATSHTLADYYLERERAGQMIKFNDNSIPPAPPNLMDLARAIPWPRLSVNYLKRTIRRRKDALRRILGLQARSTSSRVRI